MCWCWETLPARPDLELIQYCVSLEFLGQKLTLWDVLSNGGEDTAWERAGLPSFFNSPSGIPSRCLSCFFTRGKSVASHSSTFTQFVCFLLLPLPSTWALDGPPVAQHPRASWAWCTLPIRSLELTGDSLPLQPAGLLWLSIQYLTPLLWF